ncbi:MAG: class I SAM-dependent methyltransferase [Microcoleaceae cyanobacterium]
MTHDKLLHTDAQRLTPNHNKPRWAGENWLSRGVNLLIQTQPIYALMKQQARKVLITTAEKNGIPWRLNYQQLEQSGAQQLLSEIVNPEVTYPDYYQKPFHAYDQGNLCWQAAFEAESATYAMALRVWPQERLSWQGAQNRLRSSFHQVLGQYCPPTVATVLDVGCSVGISTLALHRYFQTQLQDLLQDPSQDLLQDQAQPNVLNVQTIGLDLSPQMLSVAKTQDRDHEIQEWRHAQAESTGFSDQTFDVVTLQFVIHELPHQATREIFREILRILRPGGCLGIVDNNPKSPVIQNLPPVLFTLMKSTEPWSDDYYTFDVETALQETGFEYKTTVASDPRHRTIIAIKPH